MDEEQVVSTLPEDIDGLPIEDPSYSDIESVSEVFHVETEAVQYLDGSKDSVWESVFLGESREDTIIMAAPSNRAAASIQISNADVYTLMLGNEELKVIFPQDAEIKVIDNVLVNVGSSNVTGTILSNDRIPINTFTERTYTLLPLYSAGSNSNRYRYSASGYMTTYYINNNNLTSTQQYMNNEVTGTPAFGNKFLPYQIVIIGLLALLAGIQIIGGFFRK